MKFLGKKKAFTIVELVIVIAIIAILAAVLVPTFTSVVKKAKESNDTQLVKNLNTALAADAAVNGKHTTMYDALKAAEDFGYIVSKINASANGNEILWDSVNDVFCYLKEGATEPEYIPDSKTQNAEKYQLWKIYTDKTKAEASEYSVYWNGAELDAITLSNVGFDAGTKTVNSVTYKGDQRHSVVIRTNSASTTLTINAATDTVSHYDEVGNVVIVAVDPNNSYHEYGVAEYIGARYGHVVFEETAVVTVFEVNVLTAADVEHIVYDKKGDAVIGAYTVGFGFDAEKANENFETPSIEEQIAIKEATVAIIKSSDPTVTAVVNTDEVTIKITDNDGLLVGVYESFNDAVDYISNGYSIYLLSDIEVSETIPVSVDLVLNLQGFTITNNVKNNRMIRLYDSTITIYGDGGNINTPDSNIWSYGFIDMRNTSGASTGNERIVAENVSFYGTTSGGSLFAGRHDSQSVIFTNVNVDTPLGTGEMVNGYAHGNTYSIINGYNLVDFYISVTGGTFNYNSRNETAGVFQAGNYNTDIMLPDSTNAYFKDIIINTNVGPIFECHGITRYENCTINCSSSNSYYASAMAAALNSNVTVKGGTYKGGNYGAYIYSTGGTMTISDGYFEGSLAAIRADKGAMKISGGKFVGAIQITENATLVITGGEFSEDPTAYVATGYQAIEINGVWTVSKAN